MQWVENGIILSSRVFGEGASILTCLTQNQGLYRGLFKPWGKIKVVPQPGTFVKATWSARLPESLGRWTLETRAVPFASILHNPLPLKALLCACSLVEVLIPERENPPKVYEVLSGYLKSSVTEFWAMAYIEFEKSLLQTMGFFLDLETCAVTGKREDLFYISPRSGKAVSEEAGKPYHDKLLLFPEVLRISSRTCFEDLCAVPSFASPHSSPAPASPASGASGVSGASPVSSPSPCESSPESSYCEVSSLPHASGAHLNPHSQNQGPKVSPESLHHGLKVLSYFWEKFVLHPQGLSLPPIRQRFLQQLGRYHPPFR